MKQRRPEEEISVCEQCGASVYREHLNSGIARYEAGKLLCSHCVAERERSHDAAVSGAVEDFAPIELDIGDQEQAPVDMSSSRIHTLSSAALGSRQQQTDFRRSLQPESQSATRCRTFHCRLSEGAVDFMTNQINEWIDQNNDITIKFVTSTIGMFEGKHTEPNLILTVFY